ncbi:hypothetical protein F4775DRAFT_383311 [Biscogniauxia sp. FL1348]|nr:hypothetical protein F4775DRAFT_383311 [Biscogniauxia sp. FL1348]
MHLSLAAVFTLLLTATPLAYAQNADNAIAAHPRNFQVEARDGIDLSNIDILDEDISELDVRAKPKGTNHCSNIAKIKRVKPEYKGNCNPANSRGFRSAHNCKNDSGKSYLCVQDNKATCYQRD